MSTISDKVLDKIKKDKLTPKPRWQFQLRDGGQWLALGAFIFLIVSASGLLMYFLSDGPWLHGGRFGFGMLFARMPLLLLALVLIGGLLAIYDFKRTGKGYRFSTTAVGASLLAVAALAGWLFYFSGLSRGMDSAFSKSALYQDRGMFMRQVWQKPMDGLLAGKIIDIQGANNFTLIDLDGKEWQVESTKAVWRHNLSPVLNLEIKLIGNINNEVFFADEVRPWMGGSGCTPSILPETCSMMK